MPPDQQRLRTEEPKEDEKRGEERKNPQSAEDRITALEAALAASRAASPLNPIPDNGAGEGSDVAETWSLFEQQRAQSKKKL
jgi:hypothetical protein